MKKSKNIVTLIMFLALILNFFVLSLTSAENIKQKEALSASPHAGDDFDLSITLSADKLVQIPVTLNIHKLLHSKISRIYSEVSVKLY